MRLIDDVAGTVRDGVRALALRAMRRRADAVDLFSSAAREDPYPTYAVLRDRGPLAAGAMTWFSADHATCEAMLRHPGTRTALSRQDDDLADLPPFQRWLFAPPDRGDTIQPIGPDTMIGLDGADHARLRRLVSGVFTPRAVAELRPRLTSLCEGLVDGAVARGGPVELMDAVANVFPVLAICEVLGIPEADHRRFKEWGTAIAVDLDGQPNHRDARRATEALRELEHYLRALLGRRRREPGEDVLSMLVVHEQDGERLTDRELVGTAMLLLVAGFETTVNLIGNGTVALAARPDQQELLREDRSLVPGAVEELLRFDAPVQLSGRILGEPVEDDRGRTVPVGSPVSLLLGGANRDPSVFPDPDVLDVTRANARQHLSFASGPHYCLGASLVRLEGEIAFSTLLERFGTLALAGPPRRRATVVLRGYDRVPLRPPAG